MSIDRKGDRNCSVDLTKYCASLGIIAIHTKLFADCDPRLYFFFVQILARFAVPFFAICSGYYAARNVDSKNEISSRSKSAFWWQWAKIILLYAVWTVLYLLYSVPAWPGIGWTVKDALLDYVHAVVISGSHYHLWYLLCLIYSWPLFFLCRRFLKKKQMLVASLLLWLVGVCIYAYPHLLPVRFSQFVDVLDRIPAFRDTVFRLLPLLLLGGLIRDRARTPSRRMAIFGTVACTALLIAEAWVLFVHGHEKLSYLLMTYPAAFFFFSLIIGIKTKQNRKFASLGAASSIVYCFHPMVSDYLLSAKMNSLLSFIATAIISTSLALLWCAIKKRWLQKRHVKEAA